MKIKFTIFLITSLFLQSGYAQEDTTNINTWVPSAVVGLNISQIAFSNWTQGGENSLTWTFITTGGLNYPGTNWSVRNNLKLAYGRTKIGGEEYRTNDNELYLESVLSKNVGWAVDPYFSNTIRTAVAPGFSYDSIPPVEIADFFDPGYITQSIGFVYERTKSFNTRLGVALQEVITNVHTQYSDDAETDEIEKFKLETGIESVTNGEFIVAENLLAKSTLRLFSRFESFDVWDVRWDNVIAAKINDFLNVNLTFLIVYEKQQSLKTQVKQTLQLGFTYTLL
ncbi:MAG: DUF3078 domain-containing protein [Ignavibacteriaceae bacterium]